MHDDHTLVLAYRVKVGHTEVVVAARTVEDAIAKARQRLIQDMPRFYDVIQRLGRQKFDVQRAA